MGNHPSRPSDAAVDADEAPRLRKGRKATKRISKITLFVIVGSSALFEVKRTQHAALEDDVAAPNATTKKSEIQISIRQLPIDGNPIVEGALTTEDLASIKLQKARRNSIHSFSLNFDRERACSKSLDFDEDMRVTNGKPGHEPYVIVDLDCSEADDDAPVRLHFEFQAEAESHLASHQPQTDEDAESDCSDSSSFALQISKLAASAIESENETVEKWGEKLAKAIESKIGQPTSVVIKKASRRREKRNGKRVAKKREQDSAEAASSPEME